MILTPLQKLPKNVGDLGKSIIVKGFKKLPKVQKSPDLATLPTRQDVRKELLCVLINHVSCQIYSRLMDILGHSLKIFRRTLQCCRPLLIGKANSQNILILS